VLYSDVVRLEYELRYDLAVVWVRRDWLKCQVDWLLLLYKAHDMLDTCILLSIYTCCTFCYLNYHHVTCILYTSCIIRRHVIHVHTYFVFYVFHISYIFSYWYGYSVYFMYTCSYYSWYYHTILLEFKPQMENNKRWYMLLTQVDNIDMSLNIVSYSTY